MDSSEIAETARLLQGMLARRAAAQAAPRAPAPVEPPPPEVSPGAPAAGGIERVLAAICAAPGIKGAVLADAGGLMMGSHGDASAPERMAAYSVVLGSVLDQAGRLLGAVGRERAAVRLSDGEEAVLDRFSAAGRTYHLIVLHDVGIPGGVDLTRAVAEMAGALASR